MFLSHLFWSTWLPKERIDGVTLEWMKWEQNIKLSFKRHRTAMCPYLAEPSSPSRCNNQGLNQNSGASPLGCLWARSVHVPKNLDSKNRAKWDTVGEHEGKQKCSLRCKELGAQTKPRKLGREKRQREGDEGKRVKKASVSHVCWLKCNLSLVWTQGELFKERKPRSPSRWIKLEFLQVEPERRGLGFYFDSSCDS